MPRTFENVSKIGLDSLLIQGKCRRQKVTTSIQKRRNPCRCRCADSNKDDLARDVGEKPLGSKLIASGAVAFGATAFILKGLWGGGSLADLAEQSVDYDVALSNGRPSVVEFYADWCEVCKSKASESLKLQRRYGNRLNFVMVNVENPKWSEEVAEYGIGGIPHWEYLDSSGRSKGFVVGNLPKEILEANAASLYESDEKSLPYARRAGAASPVQQNSDATTQPTIRREGGQMPRDHGS